VRESELDRLRYRSFIIFLLIFGILIGAELLDELYIMKIQPTKIDLFPLWLRNWDLAVFTILNERLSWPFLDPVMLFITHVGSTVFWLFVSVFLWVTKRRRESVLLAVSIVIGGLVFLSVKVVFPRVRPSLAVQGARALDLEGGGSFPSGHSKNGFTAAVVLGSKWKTLRLPLYTLACLVAVSRVYVGVHWPFDVIVGAVVGWVIGKLTMRYETKIMNVLNRVAGRAKTVRGVGFAHPFTSKIVREVMRSRLVC
jgi:undecaprenyl-diphosphatase